MQLEVSSSNGTRNSVWEDEIKPNLLRYALHPSEEQSHKPSPLVGMILKGKVFERRIALGAPPAKDVQPPLVPLELEEAEDLALDVVERVLPRFRELLLDGSFNGAHQNASVLTSWFIGFCCLNFAGTWRPWHRRRLTCIDYEYELDHEPNPFDEVDAVILDLTIEHFLEYLDPDDQQIIRLTSTGDFSDKQIAEIIGRRTRANNIRQSDIRNIQYRRKRSQNTVNRHRQREQLLEENWGSQVSPA